MPEILKNPLVEFVLAADKFLSTGDEGKFVVKQDPAGDYRFQSVVYDLLKGYVATGPSAESAITYRNLCKIIGKQRFKRICCREGIELNLDGLKTGNILLTASAIHKILIGLGDIRLEDLKEIARAQGRSLTDLSPFQIDELYEQLLPWSEVNNFFMSHCKGVEYFDKVVSSGKGFEGLQERIWTILHSRDVLINEGYTSALHAKMAEVEMLTSRFIDREPPMGSVVRLQGGYFSVDRIFSRGGAHINALVEIASEKPRTILLCRGTAWRPTATGRLLSGVNDWLKEIGLLGVKSVWREIKRYLDEKSLSHVELYGKSLGGAHAQYLAALVSGKTSTKVKALVTNSSTGVPEIVDEIFRTNVKKLLPEQQPHIIIVRNGGIRHKNEIDDVPAVGGTHLYLENRTKVFYLTPKRYISPVENMRVTSPTLRSLWKSLKTSHGRQTTLAAFNVLEGKNTKEEAQKGLVLESTRRMLAQVIDLLTFGILNDQDFAKYYAAE